MGNAKIWTASELNAIGWNPSFSSRKPGIVNAVVIAPTSAFWRRFFRGPVRRREIRCRNDRGSRASKQLPGIRSKSQKSAEHQKGWLRSIRLSWFSCTRSFPRQSDIVKDIRLLRSGSSIWTNRKGVFEGTVTRQVTEVSRRQRLKLHTKCGETTLSSMLDYCKPRLVFQSQRKG